MPHGAAWLNSGRPSRDTCLAAWVFGPSVSPVGRRGYAWRTRYPKCTAHTVRKCGLSKSGSMTVHCCLVWIRLSCRYDLPIPSSDNLEGLAVIIPTGRQGSWGPERLGH